MDFMYTQPSPQQIENRLHNFVIFEPSHTRIHTNDIFLQGKEVFEFFEQLQEKYKPESDLKHQTFQNRIMKIQRMLDLLSNSDQVIITKFFDKIWRRYSYVSNLGELFLDFPNFKSIFPELTKDSELIIANRMLSDSDDDSDDDNSDNDQKEESEENTSSAQEEVH